MAIIDNDNRFIENSTVGASGWESNAGNTGNWDIGTHTVDNVIKLAALGYSMGDIQQLRFNCSVGEAFTSVANNATLQLVVETSATTAFTVSRTLYTSEVIGVANITTLEKAATTLSLGYRFSFQIIPTHAQQYLRIKFITATEDFDGGTAEAFLEMGAGQTNRGPVPIP